jgi:hypothetical protein
LRAEWKRHEPVRWPEARAVQERFTTLVGQWRARLDAERRRNADARRALVDAALALATREPLEAAIAEAKRLQETWKSAGYTDARDDRALWQEFRTALDAVFARRDAARDADRLAREQAAAEAATRAAEEAARREEKQRAARGARQAEIDAALALADGEDAWLAGGSVDADALQARVDGLARSPLATALRARIAAIARDRKPSAEELAAQAARLADLTLDVEILCNIPSPPELAAARMARKLAKLGNSMRGGQANGDPRKALVDGWLAVGPVDPAVRAPLLARVRAVLAG